jgi:hypothetical protein
MIDLSTDLSSGRSVGDVIRATAQTSKSLNPLEYLGNYAAGLFLLGSTAAKRFKKITPSEGSESSTFSLGVSDFFKMLSIVNAGGINPDFQLGERIFEGLKISKPKDEQESPVYAPWPPAYLGNTKGLTIKSSDDVTHLMHEYIRVSIQNQVLTRLFFMLTPLIGIDPKMSVEFADRVEYSYRSHRGGTDISDDMRTLVSPDTWHGLRSHMREMEDMRWDFREIDDRRRRNDGPFGAREILYTLERMSRFSPELGEFAYLLHRTLVEGDLEGRVPAERPPARWFRGLRPQKNDKAPRSNER